MCVATAFDYYQFLPRTLVDSSTVSREPLGLSQSLPFMDLLIRPDWLPEGQGLRGLGFWIRLRTIYAKVLLQSFTALYL